MDDFIISKLLEIGLIGDDILVFEENKIDTQEFYELTYEDLRILFPNKLGIAKKVFRLILSLCTPYESQYHQYHNRDWKGEFALAPLPISSHIVDSRYYYCNGGQNGTSLSESVTTTASEPILLEDENENVVFIKSPVNPGQIVPQIENKIKSQNQDTCNSKILQNLLKVPEISQITENPILAENILEEYPQNSDKEDGPVSPIQVDKIKAVGLMNKTESQDLETKEGKNQTIFIVQDLPTERLMKVSKEHLSFIEASIKSAASILHTLVESKSVEIVIPWKNVSDQIKIRGLPSKVKQATEEIRRIAESTSIESVTVDRRYRPYICGLDREKLRNLARETNTLISVSGVRENRDSYEILVRGNSTGVAFAVEELNKRIKETKLFVSYPLEIDKSLHKYVVGYRRKNIHDILAQMDVVVEVPPEDSSDVTIILWGLPEKISQAADLIHEKCNASGHIKESMIIKPELQKILFGKDQNGAVIIDEIRKSSYPCRIKFSDSDQGAVTIEGTTDAVRNAKRQISNVINRQKEIKMEVDQKYHRYFVRNYAKLIKDIENECGNIRITFPRLNPANPSNIIVLKGSPHCAQLAMKLILKEVENIDKKTKTESHSVPERKVRMKDANSIIVTPKKTKRFLEIDRAVYSRMIGLGGSEISKLQREYEVHVQFPKPTDTHPNLVSISGNDVEQVHCVETILLGQEIKFLAEGK